MHRVSRGQESNVEKLEFVFEPRLQCHGLALVLDGNVVEDVKHLARRAMLLNALRQVVRLANADAERREQYVDGGLAKHRWYHLR